MPRKPVEGQRRSTPAALSPPVAEARQRDLGLEADFKKTKNPVLAWVAILESLSARERQFPDWVVEYLFAAASNLHELTLRPYKVERTQGSKVIEVRNLKAPGPREIAPSIASALGFIPGGVEAHVLRRDSPKDHRVREKMGPFNPLKLWSKVPSIAVAGWVDQQCSFGATRAQALQSAMTAFAMSKRAVERACSEHRPQHTSAKK